MYGPISDRERMSLWCDGLKMVDAVVRHKRPANATEVPDEDDDDEDVSRKKPTTAKPKKNEGAEAAVESIVEKLKDLHRESGYTPMQFRIWAEMHNGGLHPSLDEPPKQPCLLVLVVAKQHRRNLQLTPSPKQSLSLLQQYHPVSLPLPHTLVELHWGQVLLN